MRMLASALVSDRFNSGLKKSPPGFDDLTLILFLNFFQNFFIIDNFFELLIFQKALPKIAFVERIG